MNKSYENPMPHQSRVVFFSTIQIVSIIDMHILYTLLTADFPTNDDLATFADDTAILVKHYNPETAG